MKQATYDLHVPSAQGDLMVMRVAELPPGLTEDVVKSGHVLAHSETGHHHVLDLKDAHEAKLFRTKDANVCYLVLDGAGAEAIHKRTFDTHEGLALGAGVWLIGNEVEYTPEGYRRATD
jgi:hypothetical protein